MRYYKIIDSQTVFYKDPLVVNGMQIFNPSQEILELAGWQVYVEPEPIPVDTTQYEPYSEDVVAKIKELLQPEVTSKTDEEALNFIELFPSWQSRIGQSVQIGERLYYNEKLWKVLQSHTVQEEWKPDISASLFVQIAKESEAGTIDNPIEYSINMELVEGKYYIEDGVVYICTRSLAASYWNLSTLVGQYVEVVQ